MSTARLTRRGINTPGSVSVTGRGSASWTWSCARPTGPARSCSWIMPVCVPRSSTRQPGQCARRRCLSRCWARPTTPMPRPPGPRGWQTGPVPTCVVLPTSVGCRRWWCRTIYAQALPSRTAMSRTSTPPTRTWPRITGWPSFRHGYAIPVTRQRPRLGSRWWNAGSWPRCATVSASPWPS